MLAGSAKKWYTRKPLNFQPLIKICAVQTPKAERVLRENGVGTRVIWWKFNYDRLFFCSFDLFVEGKKPRPINLSHTAATMVAALSLPGGRRMTEMNLERFFAAPRCVWPLRQRRRTWIMIFSFCAAARNWSRLSLSLRELMIKRVFLAAFRSHWVSVNWKIVQVN